MHKNSNQAPLHENGSPLRTHPDYPVPSIVGEPRLLDRSEIIDRYGDLGDANVEVLTLKDPLLDKIDPSLVAAVDSIENWFDTYAHHRIQSGTASPVRPVLVYLPDGSLDKEKSKREWGDISEEGAKALFVDFVREELGDHDRAFEEWLKIVPSSEALRILCANPDSDMHDIKHIIPRDKHGVPMGEPRFINEKVRAWMIANSQSVGIRSRSGMVSYLLGRHLDNERASEDRPCLDGITSVGSGTGVAINMVVYSQNGRFVPTLKMIDYDPIALDSHNYLAKEVFGLKGEIKSIPADMYDRDVLLEHSSEIVEGVGIFEYTSPEMLELYYRKTGKRITPDGFLRSMYDAASKKVLIGHMLKDSKGSHFRSAAVGWPYVLERSPSEVMHLAEQAGIPSRQITMVTDTDNGVYGVFEIDKTK